MSPLRILLVMIEPPLPFGNAAARLYYSLLTGLIERGHRVTAFATCSKPAEIAEAKRIFSSKVDLRCYEHPARSGLAAKIESWRRPYSYMFSEELRSELRRELRSAYDILHLEQLLSGWLAPDAADRALVSVHYLPSIDLAERQSVSLDDRVHDYLMLRAERHLLRSFKYFRAITSRLIGPIKAVNPGADVTAAPLGLDLANYCYVPDERRTDSQIVSLIGSMDWLPTRSAAIRLLDRLYPEIKRRVPAARFRFVGWSAREALASYSSIPDVEIFENVPETRPFFEESSLLLYAPSRGSGMKVKVLEAMAFGVPVVTTSEGVEGLSARDGVHAGIAEDDAGLADRCVALLTNIALQNRLRRSARRLIEVECAPSLSLDLVEGIYSRILTFAKHFPARRVFA